MSQKKRKQKLHRRAVREERIKNKLHEKENYEVRDKTKHAD